MKSNVLATATALFIATNAQFPDGVNFITTSCPNSQLPNATYTVPVNSDQPVAISKVPHTSLPYRPHPLYPSHILIPHTDATKSCTFKLSTTNGLKFVTSVHCSVYETTNSTVGFLNLMSDEVVWTVPRNVGSVWCRTNDFSGGRNVTGSPTLTVPANTATGSATDAVKPNGAADREGSEARGLLGVVGLLVGVWGMVV
jgi:hypothetical protein